jgi:hypothetical protein
MPKAFFKATVIPMLLAVVVAVTASSIPTHPNESSARRASRVVGSPGAVTPFAGYRVWAFVADIPDGEGLLLVGSSLLALGTVLRRKVNRRG